MTIFPVGQGHGISGKYCGLPDQFSLLENSEIVILPVPFDQTTTYQKGADKGPAALIEASRNLELYDIETDSEIYQRGIYTASPIDEKNSEDMLLQVEKSVANYLKQGKFVITLGGEHSISYAPIKAHADVYHDLSILQLDAHADLQDSYEGNRLSHACVMARVKELKQISHVVSVGIRSISVEEVKNLDRDRTFFAHTLFDSDQWIDQVISKLSTHVYLTFDLDVFDPSIMPSTGTPEPGGLGWYQVLKLLRALVRKKRLVGFDLVELCPKAEDISPDFLAAKLIYKLLSYQFNPG